MSRHRVIAARIKRVAAQYAADGEPAALERAIAPDSFQRIGRAGRYKPTARRKKR